MVSCESALLFSVAGHAIGYSKSQMLCWEYQDNVVTARGGTWMSRGRVPETSPAQHGHCQARELVLSLFVGSLLDRGLSHDSELFFMHA